MSREGQSATEDLVDAFLVGDSIKNHGLGIYRLIGKDGNAHSIMARVRKALKRKGWSHRVLQLVIEDMMSSDYDHLLHVAMRLQDPRCYALEELAAEMEELAAELEEE
tara:strand:- start:725 stop:1048 length:324 start_codon:yes stop_codon:yes gene_type:complete